MILTNIYSSFPSSSEYLKVFTLIINSVHKQYTSEVVGHFPALNTHVCFVIIHRHFCTHKTHIYTHIKKTYIQDAQRNDLIRKRKITHSNLLTISLNLSFYSTFLSIFYPLSLPPFFPHLASCPSMLQSMLQAPGAESGNCNTTTYTKRLKTGHTSSKEGGKEGR